MKLQGNYVRDGLRYEAADKAFAEAADRVANDNLQERIGELLGGLWPPGFEEPDNPKAVFAPYLARGSEMELRALNLARAAGFTAVVATYRDARFVNNNPAAVDCWRAPLLLPKGQQRKLWVVPESERDGALGAASTIYEGKNVGEYWQGIRRAILDKNGMVADGIGSADFGDWYDAQAKRLGWRPGMKKSEVYYLASMALYASGRAVLFDTPPTTYANYYMAPAAERVNEAVDAYPLVTNDLPGGVTDWVDARFLRDDQVKTLVNEGVIDER